MVKVLMIGLGSIGKRHLENLRSMDQDIILAALRSSRNKPKIVEQEFYDFEEAAKFDPNVVIISTPTFLHLENILMSYSNFKNLRGMFVEKPVIHDPIMCEKITEISDKLITYVASPLRFHPVVRFLKNFLEEKRLRVRLIRIFASSFLPSWRKGVNYSEHYSAHRDKGGGVVYELIHEMDILRWIFGDVAEMSFISSKVSSLKIHAEDVGIGVMRLRNGMIVEYHVDYFGRLTKRQIEIISEDGYGLFDIADAKVKIEEPGLTQHYVWNFERNDMYIDEMKYFFNKLKTGEKTFNDFHNACETLKLAAAIRNSYNSFSIWKGETL